MSHCVDVERGHFGCNYSAEQVWAYNLHNV